MSKHNRERREARRLLKASQPAESLEERAKALAAYRAANPGRTAEWWAKYGHSTHPAWSEWNLMRRAKRAS